MPIVQIDNRRFKYTVAFANGNGQQFEVNQAAVKHLEIDDNTFVPFHHGMMVLDGSFDAMESSSDGDPLSQYQVRGDARDYLVVSITPEYSADNFLAGQSNTLHKLSFLFAIYKIDDHPGADGAKDKIIYFREALGQILKEKNANIFSADIAEAGAISNSSRSVKTGVLMKELLKQVLDIEEDAFGKWDEGGKSLFFNSVAGSTAEDDLNYIHKLHVSENGAGDYCILHYGRDGKFTLISLAEYFKLQFEDPGSYVTETLVMGGSNSETEGIGNDQVPFASGPMLPGFAAIEEFFIANTYGEDYTAIIKSNITSSRNSSLGVHKLNFADGNMQVVYDEFKQLYVDPFSDLHGTALDVATPLNKSVLENNTFKQVQSELPLNYSTAQGRNKTLLGMMFMSNVIKVKLRGTTYRQASKFYDLKKSSNYNESNFDRKYIGRWFSTSVKHVFTQTTYENHIEMVKPYYVGVVNNAEAQ
tara:strand:- start:37194 stop:38615 length:1422 start_codon:yes stop_codon:yes gene_type:complete